MYFSGLLKVEGRARQHFPIRVIFGVVVAYAFNQPQLHCDCEVAGQLQSSNPRNLWRSGNLIETALSKIALG